MSRKTFITIISIIVLAAIVLLVWFLFFNKGPTGTSVGNDYLRNLFPFGTTVVEQPQATTTPITSGNQNQNPSVGVSRLRSLHDKPVAGMVALGTQGNTRIRFVERATGHIFESQAYSDDKVRLTNTTIPKVYEALWSSTGDELLMRYLKDDNDTIRTFYTKISSSTEQNIDGVFLEDDIKHIAVFGNRAFYFTKGGDGFFGIVSGMDGSKKAAVFNSSFGGFIPHWTMPNKITMVSAPNSNYGGSVYLLDVNSGEYKKVVSNVYGATGVVGQDNNTAIISSNGTGSLGTYVFDISRQTSKNLSLKTVADKCVFSSIESNTVYCAVPKTLPTGEYPDSWYKGSVSFNDRLWKIDTLTGETKLIFDPSQEGVLDMDITNLSMNQDESVMVFMNKKDLTPWVYLLKI